MVVIYPNFSLATEQFPCPSFAASRPSSSVMKKALRSAEYGLLLALIAVVCIAAINVLGTKISSMFSNVSASV